MKRTVVSITLIFAMLFSFCFSTASFAEETHEHLVGYYYKFFAESGTVYDDNYHGPLGNFKNWLGATTWNCEIAFYGDTYPPSQLVGSTEYETYYIVDVVNANDEHIRYDHYPLSFVSSDDDIRDGMHAEVYGCDNNPEYRRQNALYPGIEFNFCFTNTIESYSGNQYSGTKVSAGVFSFNPNGSCNVSPINE